MKLTISITLLFCIGLAFALPPLTPQRFKSNFAQSMTMTIGGGITQEEFKTSMRKANIALEGASDKIFSEIQKHREAMAPSLFSLEIIVSVEGEMSVDVKNNIWLQNAKKLSFKFPLIPAMTLDVDASSLIMYDLNKNYTWSASGCTCEAIQGTAEMPLFFVAPLSTLKAPKIDINVNGQAVSVSEYSVAFELGFASPYSKSMKRASESEQASLFEMGFYFYVDNTNILRRLDFAFNAIAMSMNTSIQIWNVQLLTDNELILPDTSCANKCKPTVSVTTTYNACQNPSKKCVCPVKASLPFCGDIVTYAISDTFYQNITDSFISTTFDSTVALMVAAGGEVAPTCKDELKEFLCKFYFGYCTSDSDFLKPELNQTLKCFGNVTGKRSILADSANDAQKNAAMSTGAFSAYSTADGKTMNQQHPNPGGLLLWQIILIAVGGALFVAILITIIIVVVRRRRNQYQSV